MSGHDPCNSAPARDATHPTTRELAIGACFAFYSILLHALSDYQYRHAWKLLSIATIFLSFVLAFRVSRATAPRCSPDADGNRLKERRRHYRVLAGLLVLCFLLDVRDLPRFPFSEVPTMLHVKEMWNGGQLIHPMGTSGDFPSNFMDWPVAFLYFVFRDPRLAVRLPAVFSMLAAAVTIALTVDWISHRRSLVPFLLCSLSIWSIHLCNHGNNNWMALSPLLIGAQVYFLLRLVSTDSTRPVLGLALSSGVSFWTLYLPFIFSSAITAFILMLPRRILDVRRKLTYLVCFLLIASPTVGKLMQFPRLLLRHREFLLKVGEGSGLTGSFGEGYLHTAQTIVTSFRPDIDQVLPPGSWGITLEPSLCVLCVGGALLGWRMLMPIQRVVIYGSCVVQFAAIVISNPVVSVGRHTALWPSIFLFAGLGYAWIRAQLHRLNRPKTVGVVIGGLMAVHLLVFMRYYEKYRYTHIEIGNPNANWIADRIVELASPYLERHYQLVIPATEQAGNIDAQYPYPITVETYRDSAELSRIISAKQRVLVAVVTRPATASIDGGIVAALSGGRRTFQAHTSTHKAGAVEIQLFVEQE